jgi:hypothetical protein
MSLRLLIAAGLALGAQACASSGGGASREVKAVVVDEKARQAAQAEATREADSRQALDAAEKATAADPPR